MLATAAEVVTSRAAVAQASDNWRERGLSAEPKCAVVVRRHLAMLRPQQRYRGRLRPQARDVDCTGVSIMPRLLGVGLLLLLSACALFEPSGQRYVVFFRESSAQMDDAAEAVLVAAASWAKKHPDMPVLVASYADPYGSEKANADFTRLRAQVVVDGLVANGVIASRIQLREVGSVKFQDDPQESRRVEVIVGKNP